MRVLVGFAFLAMTFGCGKSDDSTTATGNKLTLIGSGASEGDVEASGPGEDASSLKVKVYSLYVSENGDCSDPVMVFSKDDADEVDFLAEPTLGEGDLDKGTYECVMIEMDDTISFVPAADIDSCVTGEEYEAEVCAQGNYVDLDGEEHTCAEQHDKVFLYLSTLSEGSMENQSEEACGENWENCNAWAPPSEDHLLYGLNLANALTIEEAITSAFVVDASGRVMEQSNDGGTTMFCGLEAPTFTFEER